MERQKIYNDKNERMFDLVREGEVTLVEVKHGKGGCAYKYMDARDVIKELRKATGIEK